MVPLQIIHLTCLFNFLDWCQNFLNTNPIINLRCCCWVVFFMSCLRNWVCNWWVPFYKIWCHFASWTSIKSYGLSEKINTNFTIGACLSQTTIRIVKELKPLAERHTNIADILLIEFRFRADNLGTSKWKWLSLLLFHIL